MTNEERYQGISLLPPRAQNRPTSARTEKCDGWANLAEKLRRWPNVAATCANLKIIINTKGTIGDISDELKAVIQYLDSGVASTEYTRALDAEVESVKSDEKVRMQYMLLMEAYAQHEELGAYKKVVSVIRDAISDFSAKQLAKILKVKEKDCAAAIACIEAHPDWDDERVAEEIDWED